MLGCYNVDGYRISTCMVRVRQEKEALGIVIGRWERCVTFKRTVFLSMLSRAVSLSG